MEQRQSNANANMLLSGEYVESPLFKGKKASNFYRRIKTRLNNTNTRISTNNGPYTRKVFNGARNRQMSFSPQNSNGRAAAAELRRLEAELLTNYPHVVVPPIGRQPYNQEEINDEYLRLMGEAEVEAAEEKLRNRERRGVYKPPPPGQKPVRRSRKNRKNRKNSRRNRY